MVLIAAGVSLTLVTTPVSVEQRGVFGNYYGAPLFWIYSNLFVNWPNFAVDVLFFTAIAYSIMFLAVRRKEASLMTTAGLQWSKNVSLAIVALGCFNLLLDLWTALTSSFIVNGYCAGTLNNLNCNYVYDYSPLFLPAAVGGILVSSGLLIFYLVRRRGPRETQRSQETIGHDSWLGRTGLVIPSYIIVPILTVAVLLRVGSKWSGFPLLYAGPCSLLVYGDLSWCYTFIWFGFWIDSMFFTALGYASIVLLSRIIRI